MSHTSKIYLRTYFQKEIQKYSEKDIIFAFYIFSHLKLRSNYHSKLTKKFIEQLIILGEESEISIMVGQKYHQLTQN